MIAFTIGLFVTGCISWASWWIQDISLMEYLQKDKVWEVIGILPSMLLVLFIHECIHVFFFYLFGKGEAKVVPKRDKAIGAIIMHQTNPNVYYTRNQMLIILLSPLILLTIILLFLHFLLPIPFLLFINIVLNAIGSSTDLYVSYRLLKNHSSKMIVNLDQEENILYVYERS